MLTRMRRLVIAAATAVICLAVTSADQLVMAQAGEGRQRPSEEVEEQLRRERSAELGAEARGRMTGRQGAGPEMQRMGPGAGRRRPDVPGEAMERTRRPGQGAVTEQMKQLEKQVLKAIRQQRPEVLPKLKQLRQRDRRSYYNVLRGIAVRVREGRSGSQAYRGRATGAGARGEWSAPGQTGAGRGAPRGRAFGAARGGGLPGIQAGRQRQIPGAGWRQGGAPGIRPQGSGRGLGRYPGQRAGGQQIDRPRQQREVRGRWMRARGRPGGFGPRQDWAPRSGSLPPRRAEGRYQQIPTPRAGFQGRGPVRGQQSLAAPQRGFGGGGQWFAPRRGF